MTITRHLDDATLMSFAAGSLPGALAAVAAAHVAMCTRCRGEVAIFERVGAALFAELPAAALHRSYPAAPEPSDAPSASRPGALREVSPPLGRLLREGLDAVRWRWIAPGLWQHNLPMAGTGSLHLIKGSPWVSVPDHGHAGSELTLVLRGALLDSTGRYGPGDVADLDDDVEHAPAADAGGCICIVANEHPARFRGPLARLLRPWHGM